MAEQSASTRSRRALIAGGLGGLLALASQAIGRPLAVRAANGDPLTAGNAFTASSTTSVSTSAGNGLQGVTAAAASGVYGESNTGSGYGVAGRSYGGHGVLGLTQAGAGYFGVWGKGYEGFATGGTGVWGEGGFQGSGVLGTGGVIGVTGHADNPGFGLPIGVKAEGGQGGIGLDAVTDAAQPAIRAAANGNSTGVQGYSGPGAPPAAPAKTGVYGYAAQDANARGVTGESTAGRGVNGLATTGIGVLGVASTGRAVAGLATGAGIAGWFSAASGTALQVTGKATFSRSGKLAVPAGASSITKVLAGVTTGSLVLALLQANKPGVYVRAAVAAAGSFTIYFNVALSSSASVAYFVLN